MKFEIKHALSLLGEGTDPFFVAEAFMDPDITMKRYAIEALQDLGAKNMTQAFIAKIRLY